MIQAFPSTFSDIALSLTLPAFSLQSGTRYEVTITVSLRVENTLSQSECGCSQGIMQVIELQEALGKYTL